MLEARLMATSEEKGEAMTEIGTEVFWVPDTFLFPDPGNN